MTSYLTKLHRNHCRTTRAFSLIEVTLAILVVSIGILSVLSLFGTGLEQNARATDQTLTVLFAEEVLSGIRARADQNWSNLNGAVEIPVAFADLWYPAPDKIKLNGLIQTNVFYRVGAPDILQASYRYRVVILTNTAETVKHVSLELWNSHFGEVSRENAFIYYTEIFNAIDMPSE